MEMKRALRVLAMAGSLSLALSATDVALAEAGRHSQNI
jgi:hypothetical protein